MKMKNKQHMKGIITFLNLKMLQKRIMGISKGTLGSYLNKGMTNRILKFYKK